MATVTEDVVTTLTAEDDKYAEHAKDISEILRSIEKKTMRRQILDKGKRADGRGLDDIRQITSEVGVLPRTHGSALFTRGQTQALAVVTLGTSRDEQRIDSIDSREEIKKSFMLHYNFPSFSVGEARPFRGPSRREKGHGNLAERAVQPLLPAYDDFPYTIRIVSDILESNGSSSMATVCGSSLALMDAGVPIKSPVAGIAMGLVSGDNGQFAILTDIQGFEDPMRLPNRAHPLRSESAVGGLTRHPHPEVEAAGTRGGDLEVGGLHHDSSVRTVSSEDRGQRADPAVLLSDDALDQKSPGQPHPAVLDGLGSENGEGKKDNQAKGEDDTP